MEEGKKGQDPKRRVEPVTAHVHLCWLQPAGAAHVNKRIEADLPLRNFYLTTTLSWGTLSKLEDMTT